MRSAFRYVVILSLLATLALCFSCSKAPDQPKGLAFTIVCTTGMVADIVRQVAGDKAVVSNLMGEGVDPHLYKPTRGDLVKMVKSDVIFYSGLLLEGRMTEAFVRAARSGKPVYAVTELLDHEKLLKPAGSAGHPDPHVWMDVSAWSQCVQVVALSLAEFDPAHRSQYLANAQAYRKELAKLHDYAVQTIATIPQQQRVLITAHDAFNYFGQAYNLKVKGIQGLSTESEAGLDDINKLIDMIVASGIKAVFVETSVSDKNIRALLEGAKSRGHELKIGGSLFSDAMGQGGTYEGSYMGMLDHNITTIVHALGGRAPPRGLHGKLGSVTHNE
ncbi:MAG: zinc ABC transporter substrate-binding protein [Phycisphaeraceae bacterium]|nr:zinc ABC transporter substrate-binding protein [Phycisphaeraceae bacterium]